MIDSKDIDQFKQRLPGLATIINQLAYCNLFVICSVGSNALRNIILLLSWQLSNITKYAIKTGNITQVTLLTNVTRYLSNIVTVTSLILHNNYYK